MRDDDPHDGIQIRCTARIETDAPDKPPEMCDTVLEYPDDYVTIRSVPDRTGDRLVFHCPNCGEKRYLCPVCHGRGYFVGEDTGQTLVCHNCDPDGAAQQRRGL